MMSAIASSSIGTARVELRKASATSVSARSPINGDGDSIGCTPTAKMTPTMISATTNRRWIQPVVAIAHIEVMATEKLTAIPTGDVMYRTAAVVAGPAESRT